jgi:hypothetical protein
MPLIKDKSISSASGSESQPRKRSIFSSRRRSQSPSRKRGFFSNSSRESTRTIHDDSSAGGQRSTGNSPDNESSGGNGFFGLGRNNNVENDPNIRRACKKVADAEKAEKQADMALDEAKERVREAQEHVQLLEQDAIEG